MLKRIKTKDSLPFCQLCLVAICFTDTHLQLGENNFPMGRVISFRLKPSTAYTVVARWTLARAGLRGTVTRSFNMLVVSIGTKRLLHPEFNVTRPDVTDT